MNIIVAEAVWLNETEVCSLDDLMQASGLSEVELRELLDSGAIEPVNRDTAPHVFRASHIVIARSARRLRDDFELDIRGMAVAMNLLRRIGELEAQVNDLRARMPR